MTTYSSPRTERRTPPLTYQNEYDDEMGDEDEMGPPPPRYYTIASHGHSKSSLRRRPQQSLYSSAPSYGYRTAPRETFADEHDSYGYEGEEHLSRGPPGMGSYKKLKSRVWSNSGHEKNRSPSARSRQKSVSRSERNASPSSRSRQKSVARSERSNARRDDDDQCAEPNPYEHDIRRDAKRSVAISSRHGLSNGDAGFDEISGESGSYQSRSSGTPRRMRDSRRTMDMMKSHHNASYTDLSVRSNDYDRKSREEVLLMKKVYMTRQRHEQAVLQLEKIQGYNYPYYKRLPSRYTRRAAAESPRRMREEDGFKRKCDYRHDDFVSSARTPSTHLDFRSSDSTDAPYHMRPYSSRGHCSSRDYYDEYDVDYRNEDELYPPSSSTRKHSRHHSYHSDRYGAPTPFRNEASKYLREPLTLEENPSSRKEPPRPQQQLEPIILDALPAGRSSVSFSRPAPPAPAAPKSRKLPTPVKEEDDDEEWVTEVLTVPNYASTHPYVPPHDSCTPSHPSRAQALANEGSEEDDGIVDVRRLTIESSCGDGFPLSGASYTRHVLAQQEQHRADHRLLPVAEEASQNTSHGWHHGEEPDIGSEGRLTNGDLTPARRRASHGQPAQERPQVVYQQQIQQQPSPLRPQMTREERDQFRAEQKKRLQQDTPLSAEEQRLLFATLGRRRDDSWTHQQQHFVQQGHVHNQAEHQRYQQQQQQQEQFAQQRKEQDDEHDSGKIEDRLKRIDTLVQQAQTLDSVRRRRLASKANTNTARQTNPTQEPETQAPEASGKLKEEKTTQMQAHLDARRNMERLRSQRLEEKLLGRQPGANTAEEYQTLAPGERLPLVTKELP